MKQSFETFAPLFPGFYGTVFEYDGESEDIESYNEENGTELEYEDFEWNYSDYHERICKSFVNRLESELKYLLPVEIEYQSISSPREYNFRNDSINIKVSLDLDELLKLIAERHEKADIYFKERYTSFSGFIPFHSNDITDWLNKEYILEESAHRIGALLDCLCTIEMDTENIYYWVDSEYYIDFGVKQTTE